MKRRILFLLFSLLLINKVYATPDNTMSIAPAAVDATTITASDENTRNNAISTPYNAHSHTDISQVGNTLNVGDTLAGNKTITAYNADANKPFIRWNDTNDNWIISTDGVASSVILSAGGITLEGATDNAYQITLSVTEPTADRIQTIQNDGGVIALGTSGNTIKFTTTGPTNVNLPTSGTLLGSVGNTTLTLGINGTGSGQLGFVASDNDQANIAINTSDQVTFNGADNGYVFDGDIFTVARTDYSSTSTVTGWDSGGLTKNIFYKKLGRLVFVQYQIVGTSNATSASFTLPYASDVTEEVISSYSQDNTTTISTTCRGEMASSTIIFYKDMASGTWTNSGTKAIQGNFWYTTSS